MISKHEIAVIVKYAKTGTSVANRTKQKALRDVMVVFVAFFFSSVISVNKSTLRAKF
jgi:hypothetical protein